MPNSELPWDNFVPKEKMPPLPSTGGKKSEPRWENFILRDSPAEERREVLVIHDQTSDTGAD